MQKELKDYSETELKALVYDNVRQIEFLQKGVDALNQEINKRVIDKRQKNDTINPRNNSRIVDSVDPVSVSQPVLEADGTNSATVTESH